MIRRGIILGPAAWAALTAAGVFAQTKAPKRIGWLYPGPGSRDVPAFVAFSGQMKALGYVEGRDIVYELRGTDGRNERLPAQAQDLVEKQPTVIVTSSAPATLALMKATQTVPIVFGAAGHPVERGIVKSFARPGGNVTGVAARVDVSAKVVQLVLEVLPEAKRVVILSHALFPSTRAASGSAKSAAHVAPGRLDIQYVEVDATNNIERAFGEIAKLRPDAVFVTLAPPFVTHARRIVDLALDLRLPVFATSRQLVTAGALLAYYTDDDESFRRAAVLVDKILKGRKPAELPVDQPERMHLTLNMQTAEALGIPIPGSVRLRADEVIE